MYQRDRKGTLRPILSITGDPDAVRAYASDPVDHERAAGFSDEHDVPDLDRSTPHWLDVDLITMAEERPHAAARRDEPDS
jgi:hypothetical protein